MVFSYGWSVIGQPRSISDLHLPITVNFGESDLIRSAFVVLHLTIGSSMDVAVLDRQPGQSGSVIGLEVAGFVARHGTHVKRLP